MFEKILTSFNEGLLLDKGTLKEESMVQKIQTTNQTLRGPREETEYLREVNFRRTK
jgi:hypothetical protein